MKWIRNYINEVRFIIWKNRILGKWYLTGVEYNLGDKCVYKSDILNKRKWVLTLLEDSTYVFSGDAPLVVAKEISSSGHYTFSPDFLLTFFEDADNGEVVIKKARIRKLSERDMVYVFSSDLFDKLAFKKEINSSSVEADRVYYKFIRL